jgi:putative phage-type endonuclease
MSHVTHELTQGTPEWHAHRQKHFNASEIAAVMGISEYQNRNDILKSKALGIERQIDAATQRLFDDGHACEEAARPFAREIIGEDLFTSTCSRVIDGLPLSASYDGITMAEDVIFEHKRANQKLIASLRAGIIPDEYKPQMDQQMLIVGAKRCLFMASDGTRENMAYAWHEANPSAQAMIISAWKQFAEDLKTYVPVEEKAPVVARPVTELPAVLVDVKGEITVIDNFNLFETALRDFIENRLIKEPKTDQDFADLETQIKSLKKAEDSLEAAEARMIAQIGAIDASKRRKDMLHELARSNRLLGEKIIKLEKENRKNQIVKGGQDAWNDHIAQINKTLGGKIVLPAIFSNFAAQIKNLRTISSIQNAVDTHLSNLKIEANRIADQIRLNLASLREHAAGYEFLFTDDQQLVLKANEDLIATVKSRVNDHKEQESEKEERIREDERVKAEMAAQEKLGREAREKAERLKDETPTAVDFGADNRKPQPAQVTTQSPTAASTGQRTPTPTLQRPTDAELIQLVMNHYKVDRQTAIDWLMNFQFKAVS